MLSRHLKVSLALVYLQFPGAALTFSSAVIAKSALAQEESDEFGDYADPLIDIHRETDRDACAC